MYMHKWDLSLTKINIFHIHSISTNQVQNILDHTYTFLYIYINVNTGKQLEVNTFNLFISSLTRALYAKLMIILAKVYYW